MHSGVLLLATFLVSGWVLDVLVESGGLGNGHSVLASRLRGS